MFTLDPFPLKSFVLLARLLELIVHRRRDGSLLDSARWWGTIYFFRATLGLVWRVGKSAMFFERGVSDIDLSGSVLNL